MWTLAVVIANLGILFFIGSLYGAIRHIKEQNERRQSTWERYHGDRSASDGALPAARIQQARHLAPTTPAATGERKVEKYCPFCGKPLNDAGLSSCPSCGGKLDG